MQEIKEKSVEMVMKEFDDRWLRATTAKDMESCREWLYSAIVSYTLYLKQHMPGEILKSSRLTDFMSHERAFGYNHAIRDIRSRFDRCIDKLKK